MSKKIIAVALLGLVTAAAAQARRAPLQETYTVTAKIKEITAGMGHAYNHSKRQYDSGPFLRIETQGLFDGYCEDGTGTKYAFTKAPTTKYLYLEGTPEQLAGWVPILTEIMEKNEERNFIFYGEQCVNSPTQSWEAAGVSFAGIEGKY